MRLDQFLVEHLNIRSRSQAQDLIKAGKVSVKRDNRLLKSKSSLDVSESDTIEISEPEDIRFVSRAAHKLEKAIRSAGWDVSGHAVLDFGQSTGGFSQVLQENGASPVIGLEVGHGQIAESLVSIPEIITIEGLNARDSDAVKSAIVSTFANSEIPILKYAVGDLSFISLQHIFPTVAHVLAESGEGLFLVKPQFELSKRDLDKRGVVKSEDSYAEVEKTVTGFCQQSGFTVLNYFESSIQGGDGNREFFIHFKK